MGRRRSGRLYVHSKAHMHSSIPEARITKACFNVVVPFVGAALFKEGIGACRPHLVCCLGELNDVELRRDHVDDNILHTHPWLKVRLALVHHFACGVNGTHRGLL